MLWTLACLYIRGILACLTCSVEGGLMNSLNILNGSAGSMAWSSMNLLNFSVDFPCDVLIGLLWP